MFEFRSKVLKDKMMSTLFKVMVRSHRHQLGHLAILTRDEPGVDFSMSCQPYLSPIPLDSAHDGCLHSQLSSHQDRSSQVRAN